MIEVCFDCGSSDIIEQMKSQQFPYGAPDEQVLLTATMPVFMCRSCGYACYDWRGEEARDAAVTQHLKSKG